MKNFFLLFMGQTVSQLGTKMTSFALVIWAYTQSGQVMASSLLAVCSTVPYLIVSLIGGVVADKTNKKKIMLICDTVAAVGSLVILICFMSSTLQLWILCVINIVNGFMNAFQKPASQVAVSLLVPQKNYAKAGGIQSTVKAFTGIFTPILAAGLLGFGGLTLILIIDLVTFLFAFLTLLLLVKIPDNVEENTKTSLCDLRQSMKEALCFLKEQKGIKALLLMYSVLEFIGAISFDSMYSPLLLARTANNEMTVGVVSTFMAIGCLAASIMMTLMKQPQKKLPMMYIGSFMCLAGIMFFGTGRNISQWCVIVFFGCFGSPVYQTYQTVILREKVAVDMQGRIFSLQGMITEMLVPIGYLTGAILADKVCEPFMKRNGTIQSILSLAVGKGNGAGIGLIFFTAGFMGILLLVAFSRSKVMKSLD